MATRLSKFSYQKLRQEVIFEDEDDEYYQKRRIVSRRSARNWLIRRKLRIKISGFRRFFKIRRIKLRGLSWAKVLKRLKESQAHLGDLFAGNYLLMQINPASFKQNMDKTYVVHQNKQLPGFSSRYYNYALEKTA